MSRATRDNSEPLVSLESGCALTPEPRSRVVGGVMAVINNITMLVIVLTGSALIREREQHGGTLTGDADNAVWDHDGESGRWGWWCWWYQDYRWC